MELRVLRVWSRLAKRAYQTIVWRPGRKKRLLFVVGCQRSGTTLMQDIFERERNAKIYSERSRLTSRDRATGIRLNPLPEVKAVLDRDFARLVVMKPLVETQNVLKLLQYFDGAKALFVYRRYEDVVASDLSRFGSDNGIRNLQPIVRNESGNWRSEQVPRPVRDIVVRHYSESMQPYDAGALFWYVRNHLYFDMSLFANPAVKLCKYEALVRDPLRVMLAIYDFAGVPFKVDAQIVRNVHAQSLSKGRGIELSPQIRDLCEDLLHKLDASYERQSEERL